MFILLNSVTDTSLAVFFCVWVTHFKGKMYEEDWWETAKSLSLFSPEQRRLKGNPHGGLWLLTNGAEQYSALCDSNRTGGNGMGLCQGRVMLGVRKRFWTRGWQAHNRLPRAVGTALSWWSSMSVWRMLSDIWSDFWVVPEIDLDSMILMGPFQLQIFYDSMKDAHIRQPCWPELCQASLRMAEFDMVSSTAGLGLCQTFQDCSHECLVWLHHGVLWRCEHWAMCLGCPICNFFFSF